MIYVKAPLNDHAAIEIGIRSDNTFTRCPKCGREVPVDLTEFMEDEGFSVTESEIMCEKCSLDFVRKLEAGKCGRT